MKVSPRSVTTLLTAAACVAVALVAASADGRAVLAEPTAATPARLAAPVVAAPSGPGRDGSIRVRFMQYNIHFGTSGIDRVADDIARTGADVVLLNEVDAHDRPGGIHQARFLARRLHMNVVYDANIHFGFGRRGNAILTTFDIGQVGRFDLYVPEGTRPRGLMSAQLSTRGTTFEVWTSHLNSGLGTLQQARDVSARIGQPTCATVFGGDLNAKQGKPEHQAMGTYLADAWLSVGIGAGNTNFHGDKRIDYLYYDRVTPLDAYATPLRHSDHHGVVGDFRIDRAQGC